MGDPKKAILKISLPLVVAMSMQTIYNLADAFWVARVGPEALAAVGFFFPFFFFAMAVSTGIGIGGGSAISRRIGAGDKKGADSVAAHTIVIMLISGVVLTVPFLIFSKQIFMAMGAENALDYTLDYAYVLFSSILIIFFANVSNAILRSEGDSKRAMYAMLIGSVLNIILDPLFIFTFKLEVLGAALATSLSLAVSGAMMFYWLFIKKVSYVDFHFKGFSFKKDILKDIFRVGLPASVTQLSMSLNMLILNVIIVFIGGEMGVAVFQTGWRIVTLAVMPLMGIAAGVTPVTGAAFGSRRIDKLETSFMYAIKIGLAIEVVIAVFTFAFARPISVFFTNTGDSVVLTDPLTSFLMMICLFYPGAAFGMLSGAMFQGTGKGFYSLITTIFRTLIMAPPVAYITGHVLGFGLPGVWAGIVLGNLMGSAFAFIWAIYYVNGLKKKQRPEDIIPA